MRTYDLMIIHKPDITEDRFTELVKETEELLTQQGANLMESDLWGKRPFAFPIDHLREGYYSVITFFAEPSVVTETNRMLGLSDQVVRHKIVQTEQ